MAPFAGRRSLERIASRQPLRTAARLAHGYPRSCAEVWSGLPQMMSPGPKYGEELMFFNGRWSTHHVTFAYR
jgi:hypothetical protein